jgi:hypothetical protein
MSHTPIIPPNVKLLRHHATRFFRLFNRSTCWSIGAPFGALQQGDVPNDHGQALSSNYCYDQAVTARRHPELGG